MQVLAAAAMSIVGWTWRPWPWKLLGALGGHGVHAECAVRRKEMSERKKRFGAKGQVRVFSGPTLGNL